MTVIPPTATTATQTPTAQAPPASRQAHDRSWWWWWPAGLLTGAGVMYLSLVLACETGTCTQAALTTGNYLTAVTTMTLAALLAPVAILTHPTAAVGLRQALYVTSVIAVFITGVLLHVNAYNVHWL